MKHITRSEDTQMSDKPIVIKLGKATQKAIKRLKKGEGKLSKEVAHAMDLVKEELGDNLEGKELVPVILTYKLKPKKNSMSKWMKW